MPGGIIFFSLSHVGAQFSLLALLTGALWWIPHRNFSTISAALPALCSTLRVCKPLSLIVQTPVSSGRSTGKQNKIGKHVGRICLVYTNTTKCFLSSLLSKYRLMVVSPK